MEAKNPKLKPLLLVGLLAAFGAVIATLAAGSSFHVGASNGSFNFDFRFGAADSHMATALEIVAVGAFLAALIVYMTRGSQPSGGAGGGEGDFGAPEVLGFLQRLTKSKTDVWIGGVCGGLGEHTGAPSWVWRLVFLFLLFCYGTGVMVYVLLWICLPAPRDRDSGGAPPSGAR